MDVTQVLVLLAAGFMAGAVNAIAGGGSLISFPALIFIGFPAKIANVTEFGHALARLPRRLARLSFGGS